jgi:hypothetical protein
MPPKGKKRSAPSNNDANGSEAAVAETTKQPKHEEKASAPAAPTSEAKAEHVEPVKEDKKSSKKSKSTSKSTTSKSKKAESEAEAAPAPKRARKERVKRQTWEYEAPEEEQKWTDWDEIFFVGTEWENYDKIFKYEWDFEHLYSYLSAEKDPVYVFGVTEPQYTKADGEDTIVVVPALVTVKSSVAPPEIVSLKSVQKVVEELVPFSRLKIEWRRIPNTSVNIMHCRVRRETIDKMPQDRRNEFTYALPYILRERDVKEAETAGGDTSVQVQIERKDAPPLLFDHDWEMDTIADRAKEVCEEEEMNAEGDLDMVKQAIREAVKAKKEQNAAEAKRIRERYDQYSAEAKKAYETMKVTKWYPQNSNPDLSQLKNPFVNRYYGKADEIH